MGYTNKLVRRDRIAGYFVPVDVEDGTYGADELSKHNAARQRQLNSAIMDDWQYMGDVETSKTLGPARRQLDREIGATSKPVDNYEK